jgi:hypothetical protein
VVLVIEDVITISLQLGRKISVPRATLHQPKGSAVIVSDITSDVIA